MKLFIYKLDYILPFIYLLLGILASNGYLGEPLAFLAVDGINSFLFLAINDIFRIDLYYYINIYILFILGMIEWFLIGKFIKIYLIKIYLFRRSHKVGR